MNAFALSTTATTVGNGGNPRGSTELDDATGHNCAMSLDEYTLFATLILGLCPGETHGTMRCTGSFVNMLLGDFVSLVNLTAVSPPNESLDRKALVRILARSPSYYLQRMPSHLQSSTRCGDGMGWYAKIWEDRVAIWL